MLKTCEKVIHNTQSRSVVYICVDHVVHVAVMQGTVQLRSFVLYMCIPSSWTALPGLHFLRENLCCYKKAPSVVLWAVPRTQILFSAVHAVFQVIHQDLSLYFDPSSLLCLFRRSGVEPEQNKSLPSFGKGEGKEEKDTLTGN